MDRDKFYVLLDGEGSTFDHDNDLPSLPLPKLEDTLNRYYESLKPFGSESELKNSQRIIQEFQNGIGRELQKELEEKASKERNWVENYTKQLEKWWENYAYHTLRIPLYPYSVMAMPLLLKSVNIKESYEHSLKIAARCLHYTLEHWDTLRREKLRPATSPDGKTVYSSFLQRRFYSTSRIPGETMDRVECHFKTITEGGGPHHGIIIGKGRIFKFDCLNDDGSILSPQQVLIILQNIRAMIDYESVGDFVPILTSDDRTSWAKNRKHLEELSLQNKALLKLIESSALMVALDENEPANYSEVSQFTIAGDFHSKWADRSSVWVVFRNGKISCIGEHSAYDGTISISFSFFILLSYLEKPEPDWNLTPKVVPVLMEINFELDNQLNLEISRVLQDCESRRYDVIVAHSVFDDYGRQFMKSTRIHPDAYIQMVLQLTYYKMHKDFPPTYETALMRNYYNGRTETLRACTELSIKFVTTATDSKSTKKEIFESFKAAAERHNFLMNEARKGNGIDRHLFGLWCVAYERNLDIPKLYSDELYLKSGGGGNFVLSTSTLGYTCHSGFVAPMVMDGYGAFYSITLEQVFLHITAYRNSPHTSAHKFISTFKDTMLEIKNIIQEQVKMKL